MQLHAAVADLPPDSPQSARFAIALATLRDAGEEGRKVLQGLREALANAFRHARAKAVEVEIEYLSRALRIVVRDDGCGIGSYPAARASGSGLCSMQSRAEAIGARLRVRSRAGAGTEVDMSVPGAIAYTAGGARPGNE